MKSYTKAISNCLRKIADQIDKIPASSLEELSQGKFNIRIELSSNKGKVNGQEQSKLPNINELNEIESALRKMESREQGNIYLHEKLLSKDGLIELARHLDLPVQKRDSIKLISEKIIETTIGYKLRSHAIQGSTELDAKNRLT